jgi:dihydroorotate dehydrogenase (NAD+) catalytic subunit
MVKQRIDVDLGGVAFPHPVLAASGCIGTGRDVPSLVEVHRLGGVVTTSVTLAPSRGAPTPRAAETASGLVSAIGLQNPGVEAFVAEDLPRLAKASVPIVASIAGSTVEEYLRVASVLHRQPGVVALEVYLAAPDEERGGEPFAARLERVIEVVGAVSRLSAVPVFAKLSAFAPDLVETARQCVRVGAHGLTLIDGVPALAVDADRLRAKLATPIGALSGPAIKPIALAAVYRVARALPNVPIMGVGGISTGRDAIEFLLAGAWAVQVGTAILLDPSAPIEIAREIVAYLKDKRIASPAELRGRVRVRGEAPDAAGGVRA